ncbi:MAG TPA: serine/threonine-protein kinase, partial [Kofleriaceae bacterium]|nr:serine/threonine-protein kinase [Kofleriaceae bacterium]
MPVAMERRLASKGTPHRRAGHAELRSRIVVGDRESRKMADSDDPTRTAEEPAGAALPQPPPGRLVAPLQHRDPDRYEILGEHGRGGLGIVSRAHDKELGRDVAIKELLSRGDIGEIRFLREALITSRLEHPGIVPIHEAGRWPDGTPFYVMKLVAGRSLKELLAERTTIEARLELLPHVIAVADAVAYAHKRRIIHRDLKASNVIAGDFGETVVIDWGLAKDLATADAASSDEAPYRTAPIDDLTAAGGPVGTPMYMAPEQQRGEPVDQRADVYAIGMMLWQLCSLAQVPPRDPRTRDRALRRAGIDQDLVAIIRKALAPDPGDRYRDAGALAGDLKAFKSGARISARRYSILGLLAHWTRRHRALAITAATATALAIGGGVAFVANIAAARDRADAALATAEAERQRAEQANDELVLQNAVLLMQRDPTAADRALAGYRGKDEVRSGMLRAEARWRGIAKDVFAPHTNTIWLLAGDASGAIFSLSEDRRIRVTSQNTSTTLANDLLPTGIHAYAGTRGLLAYGRIPAGIAVLDLKTRDIKPIEAGTAIEMDITPDGSRLAALDSRGKLTVWALSPELVADKLDEWELPHGRWVYFAGPEHLIVQEKAALRAVALGAPQPGPDRPAPSLSSLHVRGPDVVIGDESGRIALLSRELEPIATVQACRQRVNSVRLAARADVVAFACQDSQAGILRYDASQGTM